MGVAIVIRLVAVVATLVSSRRPAVCRAAALGGSIAASMLTGFIAVRVIASGRPIDGVLLRHSASGIVLGYSVTPLSAWFVVTLAVIAVPVAIYSAGYFAHAVPSARIAFVGAAFNVLLGAIEIVFVADGAIAFLLAWEMMTLATAALVATEHEIRANRRAAYLYLVMSHVGTGCLVAGFLILAAASGSVSFSQMLGGVMAAGPLRHSLFALFFVGFGVKAGIIDRKSVV